MLLQSKFSFTGFHACICYSGCKESLWWNREFKDAWYWSLQWSGFLLFILFCNQLFGDIQSEIQGQCSHSPFLRTTEVYILFYHGMILSGWTGHPQCLRQKIIWGVISSVENLYIFSHYPFPLCYGRERQVALGWTMELLVTVKCGRCEDVEKDITTVTLWILDLINIQKASVLKYELDGE